MRSDLSFKVTEVPLLVKRPEIKNWAMLLFETIRHDLRAYPELWRFHKLWIEERLAVQCPRVARIIEIKDAKLGKDPALIEFTATADTGSLLHMLGSERGWRRIDNCRFRLIRKEPDLITPLSNIFILPEKEKEPLDPYLMLPPKETFYIHTSIDSLGWMAINKGIEGPYDDVGNAKTIGIIGVFLGIGFLIEGGFFTDLAIFNIPRIIVFPDPRFIPLMLTLGLSAPPIEVEKLKKG